MKLTVLETNCKIVLCRPTGNEHIFTRELTNEKYALDPMAATEGAMLVANTEHDLCLEIGGDALLEFDDDCVVALTGGAYRVSVNGESLPAYCAAQIDAGDVMRIEKAGTGLLYLSINGDTECEKRSLDAGDFLEIENPAEALCNMDIRTMERPAANAETVIRLLPSVGASLYGEHALELLYTTEFTVTHHTRQSVGFEGVEVARGIMSEEISFIPVGAVYFSEQGTPVIAMNESPCLDRITPAACVISYDIPALAQLGKGSKVRFSPCTVEAAQKLMTVRRREYIKNYILLNSDAEEE